MPRIEYGDLRTASTVVKHEEPNLESRDEGTAPAGIGPLEIGTVMSRAADGTLAALAPGGGGAANCILLEDVPDGNAAQRVVVLWRDAAVVRQELRFPDAYPAADADAAVDALRGMGIAARRGV